MSVVYIVVASKLEDFYFIKKEIMSQDSRSSSISMFLDVLLFDLRYAARVFAKSPSLYLIAIITLALGIGANTAIFSAVNAILVQPLPFKNADPLMLIWQSNPQKGIDEAPASLPNALDWRTQNQSFEDMAAWTSFTTTKFNLIGSDEPEQVQYALVSANFFSVLGVDPIHGRSFVAEEDEQGRERTVILSHSLWQRRFGSDPSLIGKPLTLENQNYTVVGILPPEFKFISFPKDAEVWIPLALDPSPGRRYVRSIYYLGVIGRLKPGVTVEQARTEMNVIANTLEKEYPDTNAGWGIKITSLRDQVVGNIRPALLVLFGAVGFVLLIACANVANLLLARAASRQKEISLRAALGAARGRLVRQLLTESLLLAVLGGVLGLLVARWGIRFLATMPYTISSPYVPYNVPADSIKLDNGVLIFSLLLTLLTGIIFGLAPALQASKPDLHSTLKEGGRQSGQASRQKFRNMLVVAEIALSLVLLVGAGLLIRSFQKLLNVSPGFQPEGVLTMGINLPKHKYGSGDQTTMFYKQLIERIQGLSWAQSVGAATALPLTNVDASTIFYIEGQAIQAPGQMPQIHHRAVTPNYFRTMGIGLASGRDITENDNKDSPKVILINEATAKRFWPNDNPIGKRIALGTETFAGGQLDLSAGWREIVGVVKDVRHLKLETEPLPEVYVPYLQSPTPDMTLVVRTSTDPAGFTSAVRREITAIDKEQALSNVRTMENIVAQSIATPRSNALLLFILAVIALVLAVVGVYGVMAYSVSQRTQEIGVRIALGAQKKDVLKMILKEGMSLAGTGIVVGLLGAWIFSRLLSTLLFGVTSSDWMTFLFTPLLLFAVAVMACLIPARRAMKVDPMVALRYE